MNSTFCHFIPELLTIKPLKSLFNSSYELQKKKIIYDTSSPHKLKINVPE